MNHIDPIRAAAACATALLALGLAACASSTGTDRNAQADSPRTRTGHSSCFDPRSARGFTPIGDDVLLVDTGANHYRVQLEATCFGADFAPAMQFRGDSVTGRICGNFGEKVVWTHHECGIQDVEWITQEEHDALVQSDKAKTTESK